MIFFFFFLVSAIFLIPRGVIRSAAERMSLQVMCGVSSFFVHLDLGVFPQWTGLGSSSLASVQGSCCEPWTRVRWAKLQLFLPKTALAIS